MREGQPAKGLVRRQHGSDGPLDVLDSLLELWIVLRQRQRPSIESQRLGQFGTPVVNIRHSPKRGKVVARRVEHVRQFSFGGVELVGLDERAAKRNTGRQIVRVPSQASPARSNRFLEVPGASVLFPKLRKRDGRRVLLDPSSKLLNPGVLSHVRDYGNRIDTDFVIVAVRPAVSVTVNRTTYVVATVTVYVLLVVGVVLTLLNVPSPKSQA